MPNYSQEENDLEKTADRYYTMPPAQKNNWYSSVAAAYDRTRPRYPQKLIQQATSYLLPGAKILEIGCGPGIVTVEFAKLGFSLISLEPSAAACEIARNNCITYPQVEIVNTTFEDWDAGSGKFSAVLAATSWHWVDPKIGYPKAIASLEDQGYLILLWNHIPQPSYIIYQELEKIYADLAPSLAKYEDLATQEKSLHTFGQKVRDSGLFKDLVSTQVISQVTYNIDNYLALLSTLSPCIVLESHQREQLFTSLREVLTINHDTEIQTSYLSMLQIFQKL